MITGWPERCFLPTASLHLLTDTLNQSARSCVIEEIWLLYLLWTGGCKHRDTASGEQITVTDKASVSKLDGVLHLWITAFPLFSLVTLLLFSCTYGFAEVWAKGRGIVAHSPTAAEPRWQRMFLIFFRRLQQHLIDIWILLKASVATAS